MKQLTTFIFIVLSLFYASCSKYLIKKDKKPNIVLILADDLGYSDIGCYGGEINTPNLDRLAAQGLRFTQFYNAARCCPTRASLITGVYPHEAGMGGMVKPVGDSIPPSYQGYLNNKCLTIAELLKSAGYYTAMSGKWHVGEDRPNWPTDRGFDNYYGLISGAANYWDITRTKKPGIVRRFAIDSTEVLPRGENFYMTDANTENANKYLKNASGKKQPFFLYVAYTAPHWPLHAWPEDIANYRGKYLAGWDSLRQKRFEKMKKLNILEEEADMSQRDENVYPWDSLDPGQKNHMDLLMSVYAAQVDRLDQGVGLIMDQLDEMKVDENTLVLFLSDNGGCAEGGIWGYNFWKTNGEPGSADSYLNYGKSWANLSNTPFRLYKHYVHEGGIATPLIARWPACIPDRAGITSQPGYIADIMATCCDIAGVNYPEKFNGNEIIPLRGVSLEPVFKGNVRKEYKVMCWEHYGNRAVRMGDWKLVAEAGRQWELYNLKTDRGEMVNLVDLKPDIVADMIEKYNNWAKMVGVVEKK